jgi:hypothetical protein
MGTGIIPVSKVHNGIGSGMCISSGGSSGVTCSIPTRGGFKYTFDNSMVLMGRPGENG